MVRQDKLVSRSQNLLIAYCLMFIFILFYNYDELDIRFIQYL